MRCCDILRRLFFNTQALNQSTRQSMLSTTTDEIRSNIFDRDYYPSIKNNLISCFKNITPGIAVGCILLLAGTIIFICKLHRKPPITLKFENLTEEQKLTIKYLTAEEQAGVNLACNHSQLTTISGYLNMGNWKSFFAEADKFQKPNDSKDLSYIMIAAYCLGKIDLETLATAMIVHRVYAKQPDAIKIIPLNEESLVCCANLQLEGGKEKKAELLRLCQEVPERDRVIIAVNCKPFDNYTKNLIEDAFFINGSGVVRDTTMGTFKIHSVNAEGGIEKYYGMASVGLLRKYYQTLMPIIHPTPNRRDIITRSQQNLNDFMLLFPFEKVCTHGSKDLLLWGSIHDLSHIRDVLGFTKNSSEAYKKHVYALFLHIQDFLDANQLNYSDKLIKVEVDYPQFIAVPTKDEFVHYLLRRISAEIIDKNINPGFDFDQFALKLLIQQVVPIVFGEMHERKIDLPQYEPALRSSGLVVYRYGNSWAPVPKAVWDHCSAIIPQPIT